MKPRFLPPGLLLLLATASLMAQTSDPSAGQSAANRPAADQPTASQPSTDQPTTGQPATDQSAPERTAAEVEGVDRPATPPPPTVSPSPEQGTIDAAGKRVVPNGRLPEARRTDRPNKYGKAVLPDPDLLDGSSFEKEKHAQYGMLSEIEMGENDGGGQSKISPNSGPGGGKPPPPNQDPSKAGGAGAPQPKDMAQSGGGGEKVPEGQAAQASQGAGGASGGSQAAGSPPGGGSAGGTPGGSGPAATAEGAQVANLKVPEGATNGAGAQAGKPGDMQIGDATLQIQTVAQNNANVVGGQNSNNQQFEHQVPSGGSSIPSAGNVGVEKGRVVPKGL